MVGLGGGFFPTVAAAGTRKKREKATVYFFVEKKARNVDILDAMDLPESVSVCDVGHGLGVPGGVLVGVGAGDVAVGVPALLLGGVDVGVAVLDVAQLVLAVVLAGGHLCAEEERGGKGRLLLKGQDDDSEKEL